MLAREPAPLGHALGELLRREGIDLILGMRATAARRVGQDYVLTLENGVNCAATICWRPPAGAAVPDGLDTVGVTPDHARHSGRCSPARREGAVGYRRRQRHPAAHPRRQVRGEVVAANILGESREAHYEAIPDVVYTDPQAASVGAIGAPYSATVPVSEVAKTATYTHAYAQSNGFLTLLSDGERLTGASALGPQAGEWMQQATLAIRARVPIPVLRDVIQPFPTFSEIYVAALKALRGPDQGIAMRHPDIGHRASGHRIVPGVPGCRPSYPHGGDVITREPELAGQGRGDQQQVQLLPWKPPAGPAPTRSS